MTATADGRLDPEYDPEPVAVGDRPPALLSAGRWKPDGPQPVRQADEPTGSEPHAGPASAEEALARATTHLLSLQSSEGWWKGDLETNVTMDAEDLLLRQFLGIRTDEQTKATAEWIRSNQRDDGTWGTFHGGPPELSTTVEAYVALRLAGDRPEAAHMQAAARYVRASGGIAATRVFTRIWLALFGWWPWDRLPEMPPEIIFLPRWLPLNIYAFGCWARQTIVPLTVVSAHRPIRPAPFTLTELHTDPANPFPERPLAPPTTWDGLFERLDKLLHAYHRRALRPLRRLALAQAGRWIVERQEADGCWGGIQPPAVYSLIALHLQGYELEHPVMQAGLASFDRFTVHTEDGKRWLEACQSPVWDTALATIALVDAGVPADHPALVSAVDWMLDEEITRRGDWSVRRPGLAPGGWAFEFENDNYPDIDDTAEVVLALRRVVHPDPHRVQGAVGRGVDWNLGMQSKNGAWAAFDVDNTSTLPNKLPFCDFGEVVDPPSADVTAHVVEMLAEVGMTGDPRTRKGVQWLLRNQEPDGSWFGRWGTNYIYGTGSVLPALVATGVPAEHPAIRRAVRWLEERQNPDGGWGEDMRSYEDPEHWAGRGESTASQTAWALMALLSAGEGPDGRANPAVERGVDWLVRTQLPEGTWDEPQFTGTGFPWDFSINYHLYRLVFPVTALGRYLHGTPVIGTPAAAAAPLAAGPLGAAR
ncbi:squalene--hopene cyclase [Kitasatospora sp. NPDC050543]|uniref:squalene--hopene cyclase n=1 Tax=Kitasatospora sp. NPDC050543 TaxID=3364054 RepID=UPI0037AEF965